MTRRQRIVLVGATAVLGTSPLPAVGEPAGDDTALLRVVTPGTSVEIAEGLEGGHRVPLGAPVGPQVQLLLGDTIYAVR